MEQSLKWIIQHWGSVALPPVASMFANDPLLYLLACAIWTLDSFLNCNTSLLPIVNWKKGSLAADKITRIAPMLIKKRPTGCANNLKLPNGPRLPWSIKSSSLRGLCCHETQIYLACPRHSDNVNASIALATVERTEMIALRVTPFQSRAGLSS